LWRGGGLGGGVRGAPPPPPWGRPGGGGPPKRNKRRSQLNRSPTGDSLVLRRCSRAGVGPSVPVSRGLCSRIQGHIPRGEWPGSEKASATRGPSCSGPRLTSGCWSQKIGHKDFERSGGFGAAASRDWQLRWRGSTGVLGGHPRWRRRRGRGLVGG
jgi:hypothetical protein